MRHHGAVEFVEAGAPERNHAQQHEPHSSVPSHAFFFRVLRGMYSVPENWQPTTGMKTVAGSPCSLKDLSAVARREATWIGQGSGIIRAISAKRSNGHGRCRSRAGSSAGQGRVRTRRSRTQRSLPFPACQRHGERVVAIPDGLGVEIGHRCQQGRVQIAGQETRTQFRLDRHGQRIDNRRRPSRARALRSSLQPSPRAAPRGCPDRRAPPATSVSCGARPRARARRRADCSSGWRRPRWREP